ncbi:hypothetical protein XH93_26940 [Bradyrhizobium sp. CCBAU 51753]|nr:hypothetical protein XH93_26940 [Bradyrhizobium sp. CCBAU 51753]
MAGLDPAIHLLLQESLVSMDCRIKPGNDTADAALSPSLRAKRSNPSCGMRGSMDCFVAIASRNDGPQSPAR